MNTEARRDVLITGVGLVSSLGEGLDQHRDALNAQGGRKPVVDRETYAPYPIHPLVDVDFDKQIPKRGDQRQMEPWQRIGTYAAGLALDDAGIKTETEILARTDMIVSAGGGERDTDVDSAILTDLLKSNDPGSLLNERLSNDLRPTLFLAQLPNLLAGNISIVHKVTGSSRTFMGEEAAGVDAVRTAHARVASGQSDICLVGGSYNAARLDMLLLFELGNFLSREDWQPIWERVQGNGGMITGSMGAFLVLESPEHAASRGADPIARLDAVLSDRCNREPGQATASARRQFDAIKPLISGRTAIYSGATGAQAISAEERDFLTGLLAGDIDGTARAVGSLIGHGLEAQFPALVALAAQAASDGRPYPPLDATGLETGTDAPIDQVLVNMWGHWRGEGMALVSPVGR
ncbi:beta-ketoacyl-ACP synthase [Microbaculum marinisediminis]|uniref:Beta-ketoacyl-ACP synthase n=1 Tax=Microbaculum marinisediminis TaxID=2931392 RepID=A0AAW5QUV0_9HYPH|nr:beta-ketoacyl-ACP synthase [Microbaculum sp. A6E488]MCT8971657.1 beta-ketoacyl-ACP synthase [Microbaculum sp. A6E488]